MAVDKKQRQASCENRAKEIYSKYEFPKQVSEGDFVNDWADLLMHMLKLKDKLKESGTVDLTSGEAGKIYKSLGKKLDTLDEKYKLDMVSLTAKKEYVMLCWESQVSDERFTMTV